MRKRYPKNLKKWQEFWEKEKIYKFDEKSNKQIYSVDTPPPTVSGKMHIGHLFSYTHQDVIIRFHRMKGENIFYPFGTDDNGLPTERFVEKQKRVKSARMKRSAFVNLCQQTVKELKPKFIQNWKDIGLSADFDYSYSTIDKHCQKISQSMFIELYNKKRVYRKQAPIMWCPTCQTAIAQAELEDRERESFLTYVKVNVIDTDTHIIFATTRPELLPACVGISVHPTDKRYKKLIGKKVKMPITGAEIAITADEKTNKNYGSGVVYYCSYGGVECIDWLARHPKVKPINIMGKDGKFNESAGKYAGMTSLQAREKIVLDLIKLNAITKQQKIKHIVNTHDRCGTDIEFIATKQWFIKYLDLKQEFIELGTKINWHPKYMRIRFENWVKGLQWDWCISRQRFFGVPFPVWYCKKCGKHKLADIKNLPVDPLKHKPKTKCSCGSNKFIPEQDILDTWATSSLTPQIAVELLKNKKLGKNIFPMSLRPQAHDIINTWLFYALARGKLHFNKIPWKNILISGFALDPKGEKMSKSKGNIVEPPKVIKKYPVDALRYWSAEASLGRDLRYDEEELKNGHRLMTKLWNASRFSFSRLKNFNGSKPDKLEPLDKWLFSKLQTTIKNSTDYFEKYEFAKAKKEIEDFFWKTFCDNYLELVKYRLYSRKNKQAKQSARYTLYTTLFAILKLWAPIIPYITEEIYQSNFRKLEKTKSIHITKWPEYNKELVDKEIERKTQTLIDLIAIIRKEKSNKGYSLKKEIRNLTISADKNIIQSLTDFLEDLKAIGNISFIGFGNFTLADQNIITVNPNLKVKIVF
ncbi:valine--tRNA ligase [Candidatus Parcubacteria bacterium]|nr:valine--tRNA ligase [Candidatus Parcubacteria bacterium]